MSTDAYARIGSGEARGVLAEARAIGQQINLWHRDGSSTTLYAIVNDLILGGEKPQLGRLVEKGEIEVIIPNQTGFTADISTTEKPITQGDKIEYKVDSGRFFFVNEDIKQIANGYIYKVRATERKTLTLGVKS